MKNIKRIWLIIFVVGLGWGCSSSSSAYRKKEGENNHVFYINNQHDFNKYKNRRFPAGSKILFEKGAIFNGQFAPRGSGTPGHPIVVAAYDRLSQEVYTKDIEEKPIINGHSNVGAPFLLENGAYWEIHNLEITNSDGTRKDQGKLYGIHVVARHNGVTHHILVNHCYVHDVNGNVAGKQRGGIFLSSYGDDTRFDDVLIEENVIENVGGLGIKTESNGPSIREKGYNPWANVVIRGNRVQRTGRNAIIVTYSIHPIVEYNVVAYSSRFSVGHSIFNFNTQHAVMQYNEVYGNTGGVSERDRGALDADWNSEGTIIQYNYSHDNNWFVGIMRRYNKEVTIRYNISQGELLGIIHYGFAEAHGVKDVKIYNNTFYSPKGVNGVIFLMRDPLNPRRPTETTFKNNIFYFGGHGTIGMQFGDSVTFDHNLFYHVTPVGTNALTGDPLFKNAGAGGTDIDMHAPGRLAGYQLRTWSPAIDAGVKIHDNGGKDFSGHPLYTRTPDLGAYETQ